MMLRTDKSLQEGDWMLPQCQTGMAVVLNDVMAVRHLLLGDCSHLPFGSRRKQRQGASRSALIAQSASRRLSFSEGRKASALASGTSASDDARFPIHACREPSRLER